MSLTVLLILYGLTIAPCYITIISLTQRNRRLEAEVKESRAETMAVVERYKELEIAQRTVIQTTPNRDNRDALEEAGYLESLR